MTRSTWWYIIAAINAVGFVLHLFSGSDLATLCMAFGFTVSSWVAAESIERLEKVSSIIDDYEKTLRGEGLTAEQFKKKYLS